MAQLVGTKVEHLGGTKSLVLCLLYDVLGMKGISGSTDFRKKLG